MMGERIIQEIIRASQLHSHCREVCCEPVWGEKKVFSLELTNLPVNTAEEMMLILSFK